jgi:hypothetical protein
MPLTLSRFSLSTLIAPWHQPAVSQRSARPAPMAEAEVARLDRAFLHEMMAQNPGAMQSELDLMYIMARLPTQI